MHTRIFLLAPLLLLASCTFSDKRQNGNGHVISQKRSVGSFRNIDASGSLKLHLSQGATCAVRIETDENIQPYIEAFIKDNTLVIRTKDGYDPHLTKHVIVYVMAPQYNHITGSGSVDILSDGALSSNEAMTLELSGSGNINTQITAPRLSVDVSGSGDALLKGTAGEFRGSVSGSGNIKAFDLTTDHTKLEIAGAADAEVTANQTLDISISGSGDVRYKGAARVNQSISGGGSVKKAG